MNRRAFLKAIGGLTLADVAVPAPTAPPKESNGGPHTFRLWTIGDAHVGTDLKHRRESLAEAIRQSERGGSEAGPRFDWDVALNVGDFSGNQGPPTDEEGREVVRQYAAAMQPG